MTDTCQETPIPTYTQGCGEWKCLLHRDISPMPFQMIRCLRPTAESNLSLRLREGPLPETKRFTLSSRLRTRGNGSVLVMGLNCRCAEKRRSIFRPAESGMLNLVPCAEGRHLIDS